MRKDLQHLADIAGAEDLVDNGELVGVLGWEVWREHALLRAPPPQQLARRAERFPKPRGETAGCRASFL
jgi:hypothetical protein